MLWAFANELQFRCGAIATKPGETKMQIVHKTEKICFTARKEMKNCTAHTCTAHTFGSLEETAALRESVTSLCKLTVNRG